MMSVGYHQYPAVVGSVTPHSVLARAGLNAGDRLLTMNAKTIHSWQEAGMILITELGHTNIQVDVINSHQQTRMLTFNLNKDYFLEQKGSLFHRLGIKPKIGPSDLQWVSPQPFLTALGHSLSEVGSLGVFYIIMIKQLVIGVIPLSMLLGPFGLLVLSMNSLAQGFSAFMLLIAMLSMVVGIVNYLPLPGLDGGSIFYLLLEKIRGKPLSIAMEILLYRFAMIFLMMLMVRLVLNDVGGYLG